ncbi:hypothetical protein RJ55_06774 [Drechmeria coniospora]|nr:hypothetical protein RJ55_06774 [Drechmeria coniospora]
MTDRRTQSTFDDRFGPRWSFGTYIRHPSLHSQSPSLTSLVPLALRRDAPPAQKHDEKEGNHNRMQHVRADGLGQQSRDERRHRSAQAAAGADGADAAQGVAPRHAAHEDGGGAGVDGAQQQADDGHGNGVADNVGHEPDEHLKRHGADDEPVDESLLADPLRRRRQAEAAEGDARPEAGGDVADGAGVAAAGVDEEGDDPARDGNLGSLVGKDEDGAEQDDAQAEGREHAQQQGRVVRPGPTFARGGILLSLKVPKGPQRQRERHHADAEREQVVAAPDGACDGDERRRDQRARRAAEAVASVQQAEHESAVLQAAAKGVAHGDVDGDAEADQGEAADDDGKGCRGDERHVGTRHERLAETQQLRPSQLGVQQVEDYGGDDEANGLADKYERHDAVADIVRSDAVSPIHLEA